LAAFAQFGSDLDAATKGLIERGQRIVELFKQQQYNPIPVEIQATVLWAVQNNYFDAVPVDNIRDYQKKLTEYLTTRQEGLLAKVREKAAFDDEITGELKKALTQFAESYKA
jgi:F-type H+/Na+-transporting ATPase subunit alpha